MWGGYIDHRDTANLLASCNVDCDGPHRVEVVVIREKLWLDGTGLPKGNMRRHPRSILWRK